MSMEPIPVELRRTEQRELWIRWSDGLEQKIRFAQLRKACPCATCREKAAAEPQRSTTLLPVISAAEAQPLQLTSMQPVGNYAYNIAFSDGHDSGLYTFEYLRALA